MHDQDYWRRLENVRIDVDKVGLARSERLNCLADWGLGGRGRSGHGLCAQKSRRRKCRNSESGLGRSHAGKDSRQHDALIRSKASGGGEKVKRRNNFSGLGLQKFLCCVDWPRSIGYIECNEPPLDLSQTTMLRALNRRFIAQAVATRSYATGSKDLNHSYADTLCLPKTEFPNRSGKPDAIAQLIKRASDDIYAWQVSLFVYISHSISDTCLDQFRLSKENVCFSRRSSLCQR